MLLAAPLWPGPHCSAARSQVRHEYGEAVGRGVVP